MRVIRILVAYANADVARSIGRLLKMRSTFQVVGESRAGQEIIDLAKRLDPDVVVVSLGLPGIDGFEVTRQIRNAAPKVGVVLLTSLEPDHLGEQAAESGALSLLRVHCPHDTIYEAVISAHEGRPFFPPAH